MGINADKPHRWKADIAKSVDFFNTWFMGFAPKAYRETRVKVTNDVEQALCDTRDLGAITPQVLRQHPAILPTLRMSTCPPLARDRLVGLAYANKNLVKIMEDGRLPQRMSKKDLTQNLTRISDIISRMLDRDIFPWLAEKKRPTREERHRASTVIADRLCGAVSDPLIRNAQEVRQLACIDRFLKKKGYKNKSPSSSEPITTMEQGTFSFRTILVVGSRRKVNIPVDAIIQPAGSKPGSMPILVEAKSAGDFTNPNKRRKEEAKKIDQLRQTYGKTTQLILFLCGYFDGGYLGYEATDGIDWVWEHRIEDFDQLGI